MRLFLIALLVACSAEEPTSTPPPDPVEDVERSGIDGMNCAGAAPVMNGYVFQSIVGYYYKHLQAFWTGAGGQRVLTTWLPELILQANEAFVTWKAKTVQILRDKDQLGFADRFYRGVFGFLRDPGGAIESLCRPALDPHIRRLATLAHIALSQAGSCGRNENGTTKFWQVNNIALLTIGEAIDAYSLIPRIAHETTFALASRCILPVYDHYHPPDTRQHDPMIPCYVAFNDSVVVEAVVLPIPSAAVVEGTPLEFRGFTARGARDLPNGLDEVRLILRDQQLSAMFAVGLPMFERAPEEGDTYVRLVGHRVGPAQHPSPVLLPDEREYVDRSVGTYDERCCRLECKTEFDQPAAFMQGGPKSTCTRVCEPQGVCTTAMAAEGVVVMLSNASNKDCFGSCPEPATGAPATAPTCEP